jgi:transcription elongation factor GreB
MTRYRPPQPEASQYCTAEGARRLRAELEELWRIERPRVTQSVAEAAAQGDRSENADYTYGKRRLREIDRRVRFLRKRLEGMVVVDRAPSDPSRVFFGAWVDLRSDGGELRRHRIVGPDEFDRDPAYVSLDAPLARALLKKSVNDVVSIESPAGPRSYTIVSISYEPG